MFELKGETASVGYPKAQGDSTARISVQLSSETVVGLVRSVAQSVPVVRLQRRRPIHGVSASSSGYSSQRLGVHQNRGELDQVGWRSSRSELRAQLHDAQASGRAVVRQ